MLHAALAVVILARTPAYAESEVTVTLNQDGANLAEQIGASVPQLVEDAKARIDALFELQQLPRLLRAFANTGAFANHAVGVDYQPDAGDVMFGVVADSAIASDAQLSSDEDRVFSATVVNYGLVAGVNLARWNQPRWTLSLNGSYASTTIRGLAGALFSGGVHAQYKLVPPRTHGAFAWTGLDATTGLEYSRWEISLADTLDTNIRVEGTLDHATVSMLSSGTLTVLAKTFAVPLTVTTGVRLADRLGLYVGGGLSLVLGSSTVTAMLDARLTINANDLPIGTATIRASGADGPDTWQPHGLAGVQLHTRHVRVYAQGAMAPDERSVAVGLRAGFQ
ncbi:MAG: hypothetical protein SFX73_31065 [Kofleriaceae bacterium]|nr:hypothetical protein [Kofleriaceae bacterium]